MIEQSGQHFIVAGDKEVLALQKAAELRLLLPAVVSVAASVKGHVDDRPFFPRCGVACDGLVLIQGQRYGIVGGTAMLLNAV